MFVPCFAINFFVSVFSFAIILLRKREVDALP